MTEKTPLARTNQQNRALHKMFELLADELNNHGLTVTKVIKADIQWNKVRVKELLWRELQLAQTGKKSTTELTTKEIDQIFQTLNQAIGTLGIQINFPSINNIIYEISSTTPTP